MTRPSSPEVVELDADQCYRLLATHEIGRLGVNAEHFPLIFPVNYALDRDAIVVRTQPGTKLTAAGHANVTFEVDDIGLFDLRRAPSVSSLTIGGCAGCSATVRGGGSSPGF
jgi:nitroimidazol reductase NimA-like FMN-containing flavoprotein (pyridoxamine 5'-phosphate oxidase superfamily)